MPAANNELISTDNADFVWKTTRQGEQENNRPRLPTPGEIINARIHVDWLIANGYLSAHRREAMVAKCARSNGADYLNTVTEPIRANETDII